MSELEKKTDKKEYYVLQPAKFKLDGGAMYGIIPRPLWSKYSPPDEENRIELALRLLLIKKGSRYILMDTGIGDYHPEKFDERFAVRGGEDPLVKALENLGIKPSQITDLILSHLHFDHVGGLGSLLDGKMKPVFRHAMIHLHKDHYDYSLKPTQRDAGSFQSKYFKPLLEHYETLNKIHWLVGEQGSIITELGINFVCSHGHTPHMIHPYDEKIIYLADIIPTHSHVPIPWVMGYDIYPGQSVVDKKNILDFIQEKNLKVLFEHDPEYWGGPLVFDEKNKIDKDRLGESFDCLAYRIDV